MRQTFSGSLALLAATGETPVNLRIQVTSPGGTTKAGLDAMEAGKFRAIVASALIAAKLRGEVQLAAPGSLPADGKVIEDARSYR